jgi:hypothetical protein
MSPSNYRNLAYGRLKAPRKRLNKKKFPKLRKNEVRPLEFTEEEDHNNDDKIDQDLLSFEEEEDYSLNDNDESMEQNDCLLGNENVDLCQNLEELRENIIDRAFNLRLQLVLIVIPYLFLRQADGDLLLLFLLKLQSNVRMVSLALAKRNLKREDVSHVNAIRLGKQEALVDVLVHDLVIICPTMKLHEIRIHVEGVLASRNNHGKIGQSSYHLTSKFSKACSLNDLLIENLGSGELILLAFLSFLVFIILTALASLLFGRLLLLLLLFLLLINHVQLIIGHVEAHFCQNVTLVVTISLI